MAVSWPGFSGGQWDFGVTGSLIPRGGLDFSVGTGMAGVDVGLGTGSVRDLSGLSNQLSFNDGVGGLTFSTSMQGSPGGSEVSIHLGAGYQFQWAPTMTGTWTVRDTVDLFSPKTDGSK